MGKALEVITGRALNPGAGPTALVANTGNSFQVRSTPDGANPLLCGIWGQAATAGLVRLRSPRLHDATQGIRYVLPAATIRNLMPDELETPLYSQDILTFEIGGGGAETDSASLLFYYPDLGGSDARLASWEQIKPMIAETTTVEVAVAGPVTAGDWSAGTPINTTFDLLKANADYAVLGYTVGTACNAIAIAGSDTGNYRVGGPGPVEPLETRDWFVSLSKSHGFPAIPIINQANRASTLAHVALNTAAGTVTVDFIVARLATKFAG
jgi:hypothetical protein